MFLERWLFKEKSEVMLSFEFLFGNSVLIEWNLI